MHRHEMSIGELTRTVLRLAEVQFGPGSGEKKSQICVQKQIFMASTTLERYLRTGLLTKHILIH